MNLRDTDALIIVDVQNDFCAGGALVVTGADTIVPIINRLIDKFRHVVLTRDWHPENHISFSDAPQYVDGSWPVHCVQNTSGASFHKDLVFPCDVEVVSKGTDPDKESYSDFENTDLAQKLRDDGVSRIVVCGLATDYCVKATALDGVKHGFEVVLVEDACRGVDNPIGTAAAAVREMVTAGVTVVRAGDVQ